MLMGLHSSCFVGKALRLMFASGLLISRNTWNRSRSYDNRDCEEMAGARGHGCEYVRAQKQPGGN